MVNTNDQIDLLMKSRYFGSLAGAEGLPVIAFTLLNPLDNGLESKLFVSTLKNVPQAEAVFTQIDSQNSLSIVPITVDAPGEPINGIWFTKSPWGIGGGYCLRSLWWAVLLRLCQSGSERNPGCGAGFPGNGAGPFPGGQCGKC